MEKRPGFETENIEFKSGFAEEIDYEDMCSPEQELTFEAAKRTFDRYKVDFSEEKYQTWGILDKKGQQYTNLAFLLSDQCPYTIRVAVFRDKEETELVEAKEFGGSVFDQMDGCFNYLMLNNRNAMVFRGLERIEKTDYPEAALREALVNAIVHRDYSFSGSTMINITDEQTEFISLGGLVAGLQKEDMANGISQPRNKHLADAFYRLHLIEAYGIGIRRINKLYEESVVRPEFEITPNSFKLILPNKNVSGDVNKRKQALDITPQRLLVMEEIKKSGFITEERVMELFSVKRTRAYIILKEMSELQMVYATGRGKEKRYYLAD